jgi:hypothetical protein
MYGRKPKEVTPSDIHRLHVTMKSIVLLLKQQNAILKKIAKDPERGGQ